MIRTDTIIVPEHVHGYPGVAFGGYVAGLLAGRCGASELRVDFRRKVPVETPVDLGPNDSGGCTLRDRDGTILVEASPAKLALTLPTAPTWSEALASTEAALPTRRETDCYGCGSACPPGRGLRLYPTPIPDQNRVIAAWTPDPALATPTGELPPEVVWAAMDCPGGWAAMTLRSPRRAAVTAALTVTQLAPLHAGQNYISHAWPLSRDGRKHTVAIALTTPTGTPQVVAQALWITPKHA